MYYIYGGGGGLVPKFCPTLATPWRAEITLASDMNCRFGWFPSTHRFNNSLRRTHHALRAIILMGTVYHREKMQITISQGPKVHS